MSIKLDAMGVPVTVRKGEELVFQRRNTEYRIRIDKIDGEQVSLTAEDWKGVRKSDTTAAECRARLSPLFWGSIVKHKKGRKVLNTYYPY